MSPFRFIHNIFLKSNPQSRNAIIFPMKEQVKAWRRANQKMGWGIDNNEFEMLAKSFPPPLADKVRMQGFIGYVLFFWIWRGWPG